MTELFWRAYDYLAQGGWLMIPLAAASTAMWWLIIERLLHYRALSRGDVSIAKAIEMIRRGEDLKVWNHGLRIKLIGEFQEERVGDPDIDVSALRMVSDRLRRELRKSLAVIAVLASVAPLLGLLGTVLGMIETFEVISMFGTGNAKAMAGGISVALVTTQTGLLVSIPGLLLSGVLLRKANQLTIRLEEITQVLCRILREDSPMKEGAA